MKRRYFGVLSMGICIVAIGAVIGYGVYLTNQMTTKGKIKFPRLPDQVTIPDETIMTRVDELHPKLYELTVLKDDVTDVHLSAFGYIPPEGTFSKSFRTRSIRRLDPETGQAVFAYRLTLAFASKQKRFCMIDGNLYKNHQTLPDKAKIIAIEHDRVLIQKNNMAKWIYLETQTIIPEENAGTPSKSVHKTQKEEV